MPAVFSADLQPGLGEQTHITPVADSDDLAVPHRQRGIVVQLVEFQGMRMRILRAFSLMTELVDRQIHQTLNPAAISGRIGVFQYSFVERDVIEAICPCVGAVRLSGYQGPHLTRNISC